MRVTRKTVLLLLLLVGAIAWHAGDLSLLAQTAAPTTGETAQRPPDTLFSIIFSGGVVGITIMLILFAVSFTAAYLVFEQIMILRRKEIMPEGLSDQV